MVAFLDADDLWWPNKLARQLAFHHSAPEVGLSFTDYLHVDTHSQTYGTCFQFWGFRTSGDGSTFHPLCEAEATILGTNVVGTSTVMVRLSNLEKANGFSTALPSASDWDLWLRVAAAAPVAATPATFTSYLVNRPGNVTSRTDHRMEAIRTILARYQDRRELAYRRATWLVQSRLAEAQAESWNSKNQYFRALLGRFQALAMRPGARTARATGGQMRAALRRTLGLH